MNRAADHRGTVVIKALLIMLASVWLALPSHVQASTFAPFTRVQIEGPYTYAPPWGKALGDIDGDGYPDIAAGFGGEFRRIYWYQYPTWSKHRIADHDGGEDIQLADVNNDGSLDVVTATGDTLDGVAWYENPRGHGGNPATDTWTRHIIENPVNFFCGHDVLAGDVNADGKIDVVIRVEMGPTIVYLQNNSDSWTKIPISTAPNGQGVALLDVNRDGKLDLIENGFWLEQPSDPVQGTWVRHNFAAYANDSGVMLGDVNRDGRVDVVLSPEEHGGDRISWFEQPADPINGTWIEHVVLSPANYVHRVRLGDFNKDGTIDIAFAEMSNSTTQRVGVLYNNDGIGTSWSLQVLATTAGHNIAVDDVDGDGDLDIVNADWADKGVLELYRNNINSSLSLDSWQYTQIDATRTTASFGLNFGDIDGDGHIDVVSGPYWYHSPGGDLSGPWTRFNLPSGMDGMLALDVDGDGWLDIIAEGSISGSSQLGVYWLRNNGQGASWTTVLVGTLTPDPDTFESRGYALGQIVPGGLPEIVLTSGLGAYYFQVPANPAQGNWPSVLISADVMRQGIAMADINGDGKLDLVGTLSPGGTTVSWWQNPGSSTGNWLRNDIGTTSGVPGGRVAIADINHDGRIDIVVSEANLTASGNSLFWFAQPASVGGMWVRGTVATGQGSLNSLDVGDINLDGKPDIITGEYRGNLYVSVWENVNKGASFTQHIVSSGRESYLGARAIDLDRDGAQDIVSIALDTYPLLHLWRNTTTPPVISSVNVSGITASGATITWTTDMPSNSQVDYGTGIPYTSSTVPDPTLVTAHSVVLSGLSASTLYHFRVDSTDALGNLVVSPDFTFTTLTTGGTNTIEFAQGAGITSDASSATIFLGFTTATGSGNLIVAAISWGSNAAVGCSDSQGNTYAVATTQYDSIKNQSLAVCYAANIKGGSDTMFATFSTGASYRRLLIHEYRGIRVTGFDVVAKNIAIGSTTSDAVTSTSATTASGELVFGAVMDDAGLNNIAAGTGFTLRQSVNNKDLASEDLVQSSSGSVAATFTFSAAHRYLAQMVSFKAAGPVGPPPTVATPAVATANPVTGTTTNLSVLGADNSGEANLIYTWATAGAPPAAVTFSANGTNAAKNTVATFTRAGSYSLQVTIKNPSNLSATSSVDVTVNQTLTGISVSPSSATVAVGGTQQFTATATDQFSTALASQPSFSWSVSGGGTITSSGLFTANTEGGPYTVTASSAGVNGIAAVTVTGSTAVISYMQGANRSSDASATSISQTFATANSSGDLIVVAVSWGNNGSITCSDSLGNTYAVATTQYDSVSNQSLAICYATNVKPGSNTVQASFSSSAPYRRLAIHEYSGVATVSSVDVTAKNVANGATAANAITSGSGATSANGDLIFAAVMDDTGITSIAAGTGFIQRQSMNNKDLATEDLVQGTAGPIAATQTFGAAHRYLAQMVAFKHR